MWSQEQYLKAIDFAARAHQGQMVKGRNYAYVVHPASVCMEVLGAIQCSDVADQDLAVQCALLHDVLEDTPVTFRQLADAFGRGVADGVQALSKDTTVPKELQIQDSLQRILKQPPEIALVKLADRITNLQEPPESWTREKRIEYRAQAETIYEALKQCNEYLAVRLRKKIDNYSKYLGDDNLESRKT